MEHFEVEFLRKVSETNTKEIQGKSMPMRRVIRENKEFSSHFILQTVICLLLFAGFYFMDADDRVLGSYDSAKIKQLIEADIKYESLHDLPVFQWITDIDSIKDVL